MTDKFEKECWTVVSFDICSSSILVEDLTLTGQLERYSHLLNRLKDFIRRRASTMNMIPYKFLGDGWILLFPSSVNGGKILDFLNSLSEFFAAKYLEVVQPHLKSVPKTVGLTFGIDTGDLYKTMMFGQWEYLGRPLVVACRLQSAIKDKDPQPEYKVLTSRNFRELNRASLKSFDYHLVVRVLRNIMNGSEFKCVKFILPIAGGTSTKSTAQRKS